MSHQTKTATGVDPNRTQTVAAPQPHSSSNTTIVVSCVALVAGMLGLSYAAVPLYEMFCRVTGYGGTTQRAEAAPDQVLDRTIQIRFDANQGRELNWTFKPVANTMMVRIGENALGFYAAENTGNVATTGTATFNVTPEIAGSYFSKIDCFCFEEQTLKPGQRVEMPVSFFVDPEIMNDPDARDLTQITLSYTFFPVDDGGNTGERPAENQSVTTVPAVGG